MNDRLPGSALSLAAPCAARRVPLLPDEPTFNYVSRIDLLTGGTNRRRVITDLFGSSSIRMERPLHAGFEYLAEILDIGSRLTGRELAQAHSMLGFFRPFSAPSRYERALDLASGSRATGIFELIGAREFGVFRDSPACCLDCIANDAAEHLPPRYRRAHQVLACQVCSDHGTPLTTHCDFCGASLRYADLPSLVCRSCGTTLQPGHLDADLASNLSLTVRLAETIQSCLDGTLAVTREAIRLFALRERIREIVTNRSGVVGDNLALRLSRTYGMPFLKMLGLAPNAAPTLGWPGLLIHGGLLSADPVANCLLIALLFESVGDYNDAVSTILHAPIEPDEGRKPVTGSQQVTRAVLRDVLGPERLIDVAERHGLNGKTLHGWVAAYPGLSERRKGSAIRIQLRRCKRRILGHLRAHPGQSRTQAAMTYGSEIAYALRHDRTWLDRHLPVKANLTGATATSRVKLSNSKDQELADALRTAIAHEKAMIGRPRRFTPNRVLRLSGLGALPIQERDAFVETSRAVQELNEPVAEYYQRCLLWAAKDLVRCRGKCDHVVELFVHAGVSLEYVRALELYALSLIAGGQQADCNSVPVGIPTVLTA